MLAFSNNFLFRRKSETGNIFPQTNRDSILAEERLLIYTIAVRVMLVLYAFQAIISRQDSRAWEIFFVISIGILFFINQILKAYAPAPIAAAPIMIFLLATPFLFNEQQIKPWMSYGLIIFVAALMTADIQIWYISLPALVFLAWLQFKVTSFNYGSITDNRDIQTLHGYFSTGWIIIFGGAIYWILREYLKRATDLDAEIDLLQKDLYNRLRNINKLNRRDYRNIQLHGTVLNTLNAALLNPALLDNQKLFARMLEADLDSLQLDPVTESDIRRKYNQLTTSPRIQISSKVFPWPLQDRRISAQTLELIREVLLNTYRHTSAKNASIRMKAVSDSRVLLDIQEDSFRYIDNIRPEEQIALASSSRTLKRLVETLGASISVSARSRNEGIHYQIIIPIKQETPNLSDELFYANNSAISFFSFGMARVTILFSLFCIPAYIYLKVNWPCVLLIMISTGLSLASFFYSKFERRLVFAGTYVGMLALILSAIRFQSCETALYIPWFYNYLLGTVFLSALVARKNLTRWLPAGLLFVASLVLPPIFFIGCGDLLAGSTPGLIMIVLFAVANLRSRRRQSEEMAKSAAGIFKDQETLTVSQERIETEAQWLIAEVSDFAAALYSKKVSRVKIESEIRRQVDLVRAFLLCSEHFESVFVQELFRFVKARYESGNTTKMTIYGEDFLHLMDEKKARAFFNKLQLQFDPTILQLSVEAMNVVTIRVGVSTRAYNAAINSGKKLPRMEGALCQLEKI